MMDAEQRIKNAEKDAATYAELRGPDARYPYMAGLLMGHLREVCTIENAISRIRWASRENMIKAIEALSDAALDLAETRGTVGYGDVVDHLCAAKEALHNAYDADETRPWEHA